MKIACLSFTDKGYEVGLQILNSYKFSNSIIEEVKVFNNSSILGGIKKELPNIVEKYDGIVFICAAGIAVRMIAPFIKDKRYDPAVVVIDDLGKYSISLLSGHIGGANILSKDIAYIIGAQPIITTASDGRKIESVDMFAKRMNFEIESMNEAKKLTSYMVNGKKVGFFSEVECSIKCNNIVYIKDIRELQSLKDEIQGLICVTSNTNINFQIPSCILRPKNLNIGIGCRKGVKGENIVKGILDILHKNKLSQKSIKAIGTIDIKKNEQGIIYASKYFNCPMKIYTSDEINEVQQEFEKSLFVKEKVGVYGVCEPCAYLLGGKVIVKKTKLNGITLAISKEESYE